MDGLGQEYKDGVGARCGQCSRKVSEVVRHVCRDKEGWVGGWRQVLQVVNRMG